MEGERESERERTGREESSRREREDDDGKRGGRKSEGGEVGYHGYEKPQQQQPPPPPSTTTTTMRAREVSLTPGYMYLRARYTRASLVHHCNALQRTHRPSLPPAVVSRRASRAPAYGDSKIQSTERDFSIGSS